jgi:uncharacterized membrane protein HdeD (DUF308 family)
MIEVLTSKWWVFLIRGVAAVLFGIAALAWPGVTLLALVVLFGIYALIDGVFAIAAALSGLGHSRWWALLIEGIVGLAVSFFVFTMPILSSLSLIYAIGIWAMLTGVVEIIAGLQMREFIRDEWLYILGGIASIVFGVLVFRSPGAGALAVVWLIGLYAIIFGLAQVILSFRMQHLHHAATTAARPV